jgi:catechol 2,3-dioxygenase-like lactoylglutathione lyase family enzyme
MQVSVKRTTLIVRSIEESVRFYRDVLGFSVWYDDNIVLGGTGLPAGKKGDATHLVIMQAQDPVIGMIGLLEFTEPRLPEPERRRSIGIGDVVFVMQTDDVDEVHRRCVAKGVDIYADRHHFSVTGQDGTTLSTTSMTVFDPDGYPMEVNPRHAG